MVQPDVGDVVIPGQTGLPDGVVPQVVQVLSCKGCSARMTIAFQLFDQLLLLS